MGTIHRYFKRLTETGKIRIYRSSKKGRKKIEYGPTMYGMLCMYMQDKKFAEKIENYFLLWIDNKEFVNDLSSEGFDVSIEGLKNSKHLFQKYMDYFSAVENQIIKFRSGEDSISRDLLIMLSSEILSHNPSYRKLWTELYSELPGMQKSLDDYVTTMAESYKAFRKDFKRQLVRKTKS